MRHCFLAQGTNVVIAEALCQVCTHSVKTREAQYDPFGQRYFAVFARDLQELPLATSPSRSSFEYLPRYLDLFGRYLR